jgi:outer membrane protein assembly factor BamD (BamD/ComL family)
MERFNAQWTPTILLLGPDAKEHHRIEGFLEVDDFLSQLTLGLGKIAFAEREWDRAARWFDEVLERYASTDAAPEAQYWRGVTRYKATNDPGALAATTAAFKERYADSTWAKKASVWG